MGLIKPVCTGLRAGFERRSHVSSAEETDKAVPRPFARAKESRENPAIELVWSRVTKPTHFLRNAHSLSSSKSFSSFKVPRARLELARL